MTVNKLIELLQEFDPEAEVFLSSDDEGNSYRKLDMEFGFSPYYKSGYEYEPVEPEDLEEDEFLPYGLFLYPGY